MANTGAVLIGFILTIVVKLFFAPYEFVGLLIIGFITGYLAHSGALGGGSFAGLFGGLTGFTISGITSLFAVIESLIYYAIVMGITGAIGGALAPKDN